MNKDRLAISPAEAANMLGVSRTKVYELIQQDDFPSFLCGGRRLIPVNALENWINEQLTAAKAG